METCFLGREIMAEATGKLLHQQAKAELIWEIADFQSFFYSNKYLELKSSTFDILNSTWCLALKKKLPDYGNYIFVCLERISIKSAVNVNCTLEIKANGVYEDIKKVIKKKFYKVYLSDQTKSWGFHMLKNSEFEKYKSALLNSGILTIRCYLELADSEFRSENITGLDKLSEDFKTLFNDCDDSYDVTFLVQDKEIHAHQYILAARSEVLAAMFEQELSESQTGVVKILDCDPDIFKIFLRYLYSGKAEYLTQDIVQQLYQLADKYGELDLKSSCIEFMVNHISADCVPSVYALAHLYEEKTLLDCVQAFFNKNVAAVFSSKSWEELMEKNPLLANKLLKEMASTLRM